MNKVGDVLPVIIMIIIFILGMIVGGCERKNIDMEKVVKEKVSYE